MRGPVYLPINEGGGGEEEEESTELRRGPWTCEEDNLLIRYIAQHGEGRWNLLAKCAGLKRAGKSCRLRWLNYLKPDLKHGNLSPQEQLLILELHYKWGNRWSKIAQQLPGRTDNEIKNYWRTKVQKQARQLNVESNSKQFLDAFRHFWIPRILNQKKPNSSHIPTSSISISTSSAVASSMASPLTSSTISPPTRHDFVDQELIPAHYGSSDFGTSLSDYNSGDNVYHHQSDFSVDYHQSFDAGVFDNMGSPYRYSISDVDAMSSLGGTDNEGSMIYGHVVQDDLMGNVTDDGYWTVGCLW